MLKLTDIKETLQLDIRPEVSYEPNYFFGNKNYGYIVDYDPKLSNGRSLQRDFVWTLHQKQELILSIIKGIMLPRLSVILYTPDYNPGDSKISIFKIIDGKQRLSTIESFMMNQFPIDFKGESYFYNDFDADLKRQIWGLDLRFNIVYEYDDKRVSDENMIKWFELVNWAGTPQDREHFENLKKSIK